MRMGHQARAKKKSDWVTIRTWRVCVSVKTTLEESSLLNIEEDAG